MFTPAEVAAFQQDGYTIIRGLCAPAIRERMLNCTLDHCARAVGPVEYEAELRYPGAPLSLSATGGKTIRRLKQAHARDYVFTEWLIHEALTSRLRQLLGPRLVVPLAHHNCIMTKSPQFSSDTGWHQDIRYWSYTRPELISVWIALGSEQPENGCLWLIPGTHRVDVERSRLDEDLFLRSDLPENAEWIDRKIPAILEPGDILFFHCRTFHAASRNHTRAAKYSVVFTVRPFDNAPVPGTRSASAPELILP